MQSQTSNVKSNWLIHIIPYLIGITVLGILYPYVDHQSIWSKWIVQAIYIQWLIYIVFSLKYIHPIFSKLKNKETLKKLDIWLLSIFLGVFAVWLSYTIAAYTSYIIGALSFTFVLYLIILLLIFKNDKSSDFFQEMEKYKNKEIDVNTLEKIKYNLSIIVKKELFLNPNLTLEETAKELDVSKHVLSQYLNEKLGKSFANFINEHRIEKAKKLLKTKNNYTIEGLGYESGFNTRSGFFTTFKKITGQTPSEYQKSRDL
jgi:AraC-like DNA-binding protein